MSYDMSRQAGDIVAHLKAGIALKCTVVRDGREQEIEARDLVPGDVVILEEGVTIPADTKVDRLRYNQILLG
jgi:H+-transporting ATPase